LNEGSRFDPAEFRDTQRAAWSSVAGGWRAWWHVFEAGSAELNARLVAAAGVRAGHRVLDVATGIGEPALTAAAKVGPTGAVVGVDLSPGMLAFARERASEAGFAHAEFLERDGEELGLEDAGFDAALSRWGLMLMLRPERAAASIALALRPGARLAASVWAPPEEVPFLATSGRVARAVLDLGPMDPDAPGPFRMAAEGRLDALLEGAGFADLRREKVGVRLVFDAPEDYVRFVGELSSSMQKTLEGRTEDERRAVWEALAEAASAFRGDDGRIVFDNAAWVVSGALPG
jgi:SAM-dependent methyltransferase